MGTNTGARIRQARTGAKLTQAALGEAIGLSAAEISKAERGELQLSQAKLKAIAKLCGIKVHLTYHVARHSAATTVLLSNGVPIETVSRLLGHTNIKTTQIYAKITAQKISQDMETLSHKLEDMEKNICNAIQ